MTISISTTNSNAIAVPIDHVIVTIAKLVFDHIKAIFNQIFYPEDSLTSTNQLTFAQMETYRQRFNAESGKVHVLSNNNPNIAFLARDLRWTFFNPLNLQHSYARYVLEPLILDEKLVLPNGKEVLVIMVNLDDKHWTSIQIDLRTNKIRYFDPAGESNTEDQKINFNALIALYLSGLRECLKHYLPERAFEVEVGPHSPSVIKDRDQYDGWNCGVFVFYYAMLANQVAETHLFKRPFTEVQANIWARRAHILS